MLKCKVRFSHKFYILIDKNLVKLWGDYTINTFIHMLIMIEYFYPKKKELKRENEPWVSSYRSGHQRSMSNEPQKQVAEKTTIFILPPNGF